MICRLWRLTVNVLMLWENRPSPYSGVGLSALNILKHLSTRHTIQLIYLDDSEAGIYYPDLEPFCSTIDSVAYKEFSQGRQLLAVARDSLSVRKLRSKYRSFFTPSYSSTMARMVQQALSRDGHDVVYASGRVAFYAWPFSTPKVAHPFDCISCACYKQWKRAPNASTKAYWLFAYLTNAWTERKILGSFDDCIVVSNEECEAFKAVLPNVKSSVVPNGVDTQFYAPSDETEEWPSLVYVGALYPYGPNVEAILYFHSQMYETLKRRFANLRLYSCRAEADRGGAFSRS